MSFSSGSSSRSVLARPVASIVTETSITLQRRLLPCTIMLVVPTDTPSRYSVSGDTSIACATLGLPSERLIAGSGSFSKVDLPIGTSIFAGKATSPLQFMFGIIVCRPSPP